MYMHSLHSLFCQLPNYNLFTQHVIYLYGETHLVNCGPRSILLHSYYRLLSTSIIYFLANKYLYHTIRLILCLQQTGEIDNLTAGWGKVLWLCCVQVPHCCWCQSYAPDNAPYINCLEQSPSQLASTFRSCFFLLLVRLNLGFILRETCRCAHHTFLLGFSTGWLAPPIKPLRKNYIGTW
jgi:hypothetical protein